MARPKSDAKRGSILEAAIAVIAEKGLAASTSEIAKRASVAHGSIFSYFDTKSELVNAAYLFLKGELNDAVLKDMPETEDVKTQLHHMWTQWLIWGTTKPASRRALAQLSVSDQITTESRALSFERAAVGIDIVQRACSSGSLRGQSIGFTGGVVEALAGATLDYLTRFPEQADAQREVAFNVLWKAIR